MLGKLKALLKKNEIMSTKELIDFIRKRIREGPNWSIEAEEEWELAARDIIQEVYDLLPKLKIKKEDCYPTSISIIIELMGDIYKELMGQHYRKALGKLLYSLSYYSQMGNTAMMYIILELTLREGLHDSMDRKSNAKVFQQKV